MLIMVCLILTGCQSVGSGLEKDAVLVVEQYLDSSTAHNWPKVFETLSGEALAQTKANYSRVKTIEQIISKKLTAAPFCKDVVTVSVDLTKKIEQNTDRQAYTFWVRKSGDQWKIYKTEMGQYQHGELKEGDLPQGAVQVVKAYIELPFHQKRKMDQKYIAGRLLQESTKSKTLPVDEKTVQEQDRISTIMKSIEGMGIADGYAVARVEYISSMEGKDYPAEALIELLQINDEDGWKISKIDII